MIKDFEIEELQDGWERVSIEEDADLISGLRPKGGASDEGVPSLGGEHITSDGHINFSDKNARYVPKEFFKSVGYKRAEDNDILINKDGANTGKLAILKEKFSPNITINEHVFVLRSRKIFDQKYLFYWMFSYLGQRQIKERITGSAQPGLSSRFTKDFIVLKPPFHEQQKIAEILETVDNAIDKTDALIEKYKRLKQGLMQKLLTKGIDENGHIRSEKTHKFKDSPLGRIPEEWDVLTMSDKRATIMVTDGSHFSPRQEQDGKYLIANIENIKDGTIDVDSCKKISEKDFEYSKKNKCKPEYGDILFSKDGTIGRSIKFIGPENLVVLSSIAIIRTNNYILYADYLVQYMQSQNITSQLHILSGGSALKRIVLKDIKKFLLVIPSMVEQQRIGMILSQADEIIEREEAYKAKLERIKRGLMEDLLTGRVRVNAH